jgi:hypothetical protein
MILANVSDGAKAFVLTHGAYCATLGRCACAPASPLGRACAAVLSFAEGERRLAPRAVLSVPEVARAVARGRLRVEGGER